MVALFVIELLNVEVAVILAVPVAAGNRVARPEGEIVTFSLLLDHVTVCGANPVV